MEYYYLKNAFKFRKQKNLRYNLLQSHIRWATEPIDDRSGLNLIKSRKDLTCFL